MHERALQIEADLESWKAVAPHAWTCTVVDNFSAKSCQIDHSMIYNGKRHEYPSPSVAVLWNHWRILSILVHQLLIRIINTFDDSSVEAFQCGSYTRAHSESRIREFSDDVCTSVASFMNTPRESTSQRANKTYSHSSLTGLPNLIWPLYIVALDDLNLDSMRAFAMQQLRSIAASTGIRQASLLAKSAKDGKSWTTILGGTDDRRFTYNHLCEW